MTTATVPLPTGAKYGAVTVIDLVRDAGSRKLTCAGRFDDAWSPSDCCRR